MPFKLIPPRKGHPNYAIRGSYLQVKGYYRSTGTPEERLARRLLAKLIKDTKSGAIAPTGEPTVSNIIDSYERAGGEATFLVKIVERLGDLPISQLTQAKIDEAAVLAYPNATAPTKNRQFYTPLSAALRHAGIRIGLNRPKGSYGGARTTWLRPEQAFALIASAEASELRFGALLKFLLYSGCRLSEGLRLRWEDVDLPHALAYIRITKNGTPRTVHLTAELVAQLANMEGKTGKVFGYSKSGAIYSDFRAAAFRAGVDIPERVAFHILRHSFGAWARRYGKLDTSGLVATGAWKSEDAARVYEHVDIDEAAKVAETFPTATVRKA